MLLAVDHTGHSVQASWKDVPLKQSEQSHEKVAKVVFKTNRDLLPDPIGMYIDGNRRKSSVTMSESSLVEKSVKQLRRFLLVRRD